MMNELQNFMEELNNMFYTNGGYKSFPVDVIEEKNAYKVVAEIPGAKKEDVQVSFENGNLSITATLAKEEPKKYLIRERNQMKYKRDIYFGDIDEDSLAAKLENGILEITINLKKPEEKAKKIITIE